MRHVAVKGGRPDKRPEVIRRSAIRVRETRTVDGEATRSVIQVDIRSVLLGESFNVLKALTQADWLNYLRLSPEHVPDILVLRGGRSLDLHLKRPRGLFDTAEDFDVPNGIIEHVLIGAMGIRVGVW